MLKLTPELEKKFAQSYQLAEEKNLSQDQMLIFKYAMIITALHGESLLENVIKLKAMLKDTEQSLMKALKKQSELRETLNSIAASPDKKRSMSKILANFTSWVLSPNFLKTKPQATLSQ